MRTDIWQLLAGATLVSTLVSGRPQPLTEEDLALGTWELDLSSSTYDPGPPPRSQRRSYEANPGGVKATIVTVDASGNDYTAEYVADYDSLEYPLTGSSSVDAIALRRINANKAEATLTHARKVIGTAERVISDDGQTMTITFAGTNADGRRVKNVAVYRKMKD